MKLWSDINNEQNQLRKNEKKNLIKNSVNPYKMKDTEKKSDESIDNEADMNL